MRTRARRGSTDGIAFVVTLAATGIGCGSATTVSDAGGDATNDAMTVVDGRSLDVVGADASNADGNAGDRIDVATSDASTSTLRASDFTYLGSFRVPSDGTYGTTSGFGFSGVALAFDPGGNGGQGSLFIEAHERGMVAEISIPALVMGNNPAGGSTNVASLATASVLQNFHDVTEGLLDSDPFMASQSFGGVYGLFVYDGVLYGSVFNYYDASAEARVSHFKHSRNLSDTASFFGWETVYMPAFAGMLAGEMCNIPPEWQSALGGPAATGLFGVPIVSRTSYGPSAFAFDPHDIGMDTPSTNGTSPSSAPVAAHPLVYYPGDHTTLGPWDGAGDVYGFTATLNGMFMHRGSWIVVGANGIGHAVNPLTGMDTNTAYYGIGTTDWSLNGTLVPGGGGYYAYDPAFAGTHSQHAWPYRYQMWGYDLNDLAAVHAGTKQPWEPVPYAVWEWVMPFDEPSHKGIVSAFDPASRRLYVAQLWADVGAAPLIHVFQVAD